MTEQTPEKVFVDGILIPSICSTETFRSALNYKARPGDVFLCTYPKSGTTCVEVILYALMHNGEAFDENISNYLACTPFLEVIGEEGIDTLPQPYVIKTHIPFTHIRCDPKAKYVCVIRHPKDVCVSYYHFLGKMLAKQPTKCSFDAFFEDFINGAVSYGDYFDHLKSVWRLKDNANVCLTSYEEIRQDLRAVIRKLAQFLNIELKDDLLEHTAYYSSFAYMKERFDTAYTAGMKVKLADGSLSAAAPGMKKMLEELDEMELVRAGVVGGWSAIMSEKQSQRLDKVFLEKTKDMPGLDRFFSPSDK